MQIQSCEPVRQLADPTFPYLTPTADIKERLNDIIRTVITVRENVLVVRDPQARILFDTTREVLKDLVAAYDLYQQRGSELHSDTCISVR
jgi:hypothetical protein